MPATRPSAAAPALSALDDLADAQLSEPDFLLDELEMALYARIRLQQRLRLPAQPDGMEFEYLARLSDATLQRLEQSVWSAGAAPQLEPWLAAQHFWPRWLRRLRPQAFQAFELEWEGAAEYFDTLNEAAPAGAYNGPAVPERYIALLEAELAEIQWRQQGVLQRIDLSSDSARYQRAAELLKNSRDQALQQLMQQLTRTLSEANPQAFSPHAE
ncbi:NEL-type E3 ubiquitin ligase domain-containing protein [Pseudomonas sp.]|uniref:NEL-type E3 ubiquitin ligase domain-containing protein n=1 Tax=Pseudomonas sp. TaxID=306 RepID=UPI0028A7B23E|nr:NEL-type E3 ubiquitin ligase domain-containing protein [Pseudomonas sp.]